MVIQYLDIILPAYGKGILHLFCIFALPQLYSSIGMRKIVLFLALAIAAPKAFCQKDLSVQMVFVKGGTFFMGNDDPEYPSPEFENEHPLHRVSQGDFFISKYEITNGLYKRLMGVFPPAYNGVDYGNKYCEDCPVVMMSWDDVQDFIKRLNEKTGKNYRLPTETEWEYAAKGGKYSEGHKFAGGDKLNAVGWFGKKKGTTNPIGQKLPNELSIYDMSGNVAEWCQDWYEENYYKTTIDAVNPKGPSSGTYRVVRGGSFFDVGDMCRVVNRHKLEPNTRRWDLGFRLCLDAEKTTGATPAAPKTTDKPTGSN